jgi:transcriptional regulator with XRE-family HTH domain
MQHNTRILNEKLRYHRKMRGWSQRRLSDLLDTSKEMIGRWERGVQQPSPYYQEKLCVLFEKTAAELGFIEVSITALGTQNERIVQMQEKKDFSSNYSDEEAIKQLVQSLETPSFLDEVLLTHLETEANNNRKRFVLSKNSLHDVASMHQDALFYLTSISKLLTHPLGTRVQQRLCILAGETAQLLGDICFHQGQKDSAKRYYDTAMRAAIDANNKTLHAVILGRKCLLSLYDGKREDAFPLLQQAEHLASYGATNCIRAWLFALKAEAFSVVGNKSECDKALQQSRTSLQGSQEGFSTATFMLEPEYAPFNEQRLLGYAGACFTRLRQPQEAQSALLTYISSLKHASLHKKAVAFVDLAYSYSLQNEGELMHAYFEKAIDLFEETQSIRVLQRLFAIRQRISAGIAMNTLDERLTLISQKAILLS